MEHDYRDVGVRVVPGATTELPRKPEPRAVSGTTAETYKCHGKHDYMDVGGRVTHGAVTEGCRE